MISLNDTSFNCRLWCWLYYFLYMFCKIVFQYSHFYHWFWRLVLSFTNYTMICMLSHQLLVLCCHSLMADICMLCWLARLFNLFSLIFYSFDANLMMLFSVLHWWFEIIMKIRYWLLDLREKQTFDKLTWCNLILLIFGLMCE